MKISPIPLHPVDSTSIRAVGYDPTSQRLRIKFHNDSVYDYESVTPAKHKQLMASPSLGQFFMTKVRHGHKSTKVV